VKAGSIGSAMMAEPEPADGRCSEGTVAASACVPCWTAGDDLVGVKVTARRIMGVAFHLSSGPLGVTRCHRSDVDLGSLISGNILISAWNPHVTHVRQQ